MGGGCPLFLGRSFLGGEATALPQGWCPSLVWYRSGGLKDEGGFPVPGVGGAGRFPWSFGPC